MSQWHCKAPFMARKKKKIKFERKIMRHTMDA